MKYKNLNELLESAKELSSEIRYMVKTSQYDEYDDLSGIEIDYSNPEDLLLRDELRSIMNHLLDAMLDIDYLSRPVEYESQLIKNIRGRYQTHSGKEYTSGSPIEAFIYDSFDDREKWVITRVEHDGDDYILFHYKDIPLHGLKVRVRRASI